MKIIRIAEEPKGAEERRAPSDMETTLKKDLEVWKAQVMSEVRQVHSAEMKKSAATIARLTEEIESLQKTLSEQPQIVPLTLPPVESPPRIVPIAPPALKLPLEQPVIKKEKAPPLPNRVLDALAGPSPEKPERKVAFLNKVWDHLNQVASDVPPRKDDRAK